MTHYKPGVYLMGMGVASWVGWLVNAPLIFIPTYPVQAEAVQAETDFSFLARIPQSQGFDDANAWFDWKGSSRIQSRIGEGLIP